MPAGLKNKVTSAPGDTRGTENPDPGVLVPTVSSNPSPSGGSAPGGDTAGSSSCMVAAAGAISLTGEDPGPPSMDGVQEGGCPDLHGGGSPHVELSCVVPRMGQGVQTMPVLSGAAVWQAAWGAGQRPTQTTSPGNGRGRKRPSREEASGSLKLSRHRQFSGDEVSPWSASSPPSSPRSEPSRCGHFQVSLWNHASQPGPVLQSQAKAPGPALRSPAVRPGPSLCHRATQSGPALRSCASVQRLACCGHTTPSGPVLRSQATRLGPALRSHASGSSAAIHSRAAEQSPAHHHHRAPEPGAACCRLSGPGAALQRQASAPGPAQRRCYTPKTGPACHRRASGPGAAVNGHSSPPGPAHRRRRASAPGPASRRRASGPGAAINNHSSPPGPVLRSHASGPGHALQSSRTTPGFVLWSRATQRRSAASSRPSLPELNGQSPPSSPKIALRRLVFQRSSSSSDFEVPNLATQQVWHAVRMRASSPTPPESYGESFFFSSSSSSSSSSFNSVLWPLDQSSSSSPINFSGTSSNRFSGLRSISTPSPASLRRIFLPECDVLSPLFSGEPAEIGSMPPSPTSPML
ncbi:PREDICTED: uncharacterized protein CXorf67-like [Lipotes vexillifer]|uniref:Uncharacterized protein CXorf67-like n=1 Tax=Lipotes vexillifer TaxID=118797 RepID=A0A340XT29_LIPVE|nr:PREDICTED: uncharacterized protein CXorf67-like [Lipotes vexillifer]